MTADNCLKSSRRVYTSLLTLYPKEYRKEYGPSMIQLFIDQCRSTLGERGKAGLVVLWFHTLIDLCKTAMVEHLSAPISTAGLLQAPPDKPLPWKGISLVLIPSLIIMVLQIGTLNGKDWFFSRLPWLSYAGMIPVILVWIFAKKFPVWGLLPLGLIISTIRWNMEGLFYSLSQILIAPLRDFLQLDSTPTIVEGSWFVPSIYFGLLLIVAWLFFRRIIFNRTIWLLFGFYVLIISIAMIINVIAWRQNPYSFWSPAILADSGFFLLLVFLGAILARQHGRLAVLILVGYLLPTILYGRYQVFAEGYSSEITPAWVNTGILAFRLCLAILLPIWLARSITWRGQTIATIVPLAIALLSQAGLQIIHYGYYLQSWGLITAFVQTFINLFIPMTGFFLALVMYRYSRHPTPAAPSAAA